MSNTDNNIDDPLAVQLAAWVNEVTGTQVRQLSLIPGGASRRSYSVYMEDGGRYFLRVDAGEGPLSGTEMDLARERRFSAPVAQLGSIPVPGIIAFNESLNALLMEHVEGVTSYQCTLPADRQRALEKALMAAVAALHKLDIAQLDLPDFRRRRTAGEAVNAALDMWETLYRDRVSPQDPTISFALAWLRQNVPEPERSSVLVHGDVGPGNFLFSQGGELLALIDWELAHIGHPLEDLACVLCRSLGVDFGVSEQLIHDYEQASGTAVDRRVLDYMIILVLTEWCVGIQMALSRVSVNQDVAMLFLWGHMNRYAVMRTLARLMGRQLPVLPDLPPLAPAWSFLPGHVAAVLQTVVLPATTDAYVKHRLSSVLQLQKVQESLLRYGLQRYQDEEVAWAGRIPGLPPHEDGAAAALLAHAPAAAGQPDSPYLDYLLWRSERERVVLREALGPMADRHIDY